MRIELPQRLDSNGFAILFSDAVSGNRQPIHNEIIIDFKNLNFIEPTGVTVLSNYIEWLKAHKVHVKLDGFGYRRDSESVLVFNETVQYLDDSGFFLRYLGKKLNEKSQLRNTTKPLEFIGTAYSLNWLQDNLLYWIVQNSRRERAAFRELLMCFQEIFQNIRDHSETQIGSVFGQFFPNKNNRLCISISDIGVGIPSKVKQFFKEDPQKINDSEAIMKACTYGFTTSSHAGNAGRGLANLVSTITGHYQGSVIIISDKGYVKYDARRKSIPELLERNWIYPGCLIEINISVDKIPELENERQDFEW